MDNIVGKILTHDSLSRGMFVVNRYVSAVLGVDKSFASAL